MGTRAAVDIGGTFTDLVYADAATGRLGLGKTSTTPGRFEEGVMAAIQEADLEGVEFLAHGTTVVINALTERKGAVTALLTTRGTRDVLEIQRANPPDLYNLRYRKPEPFVRRRLRLEVVERMSYRGEVMTPLDEGSVRAAVTEARRQGAQAVAICFLHSYANPEHERRAAEIVRSEWPEAAVTASHELTSEWREYQRASTAVLDAYVKPVTREYLGALARRLGEAGVADRARYAMRSNGGVSGFDVAREAPINLVESGPVGGVIGAAVIGRQMEEANVVTFDIGGTTAKSSLVERGEVRITGGYHIDRTPATAVKMDVPPEIGMALSMTIAYIPVVIGQLTAVMEAQQSRAWNTNISNPVARFRAHVPIAIPTFFRSFHAAEAMASAMMSRGFGYDVDNRTELEPLEFDARDWIAAATFVVLMVAGFMIGFLGIAKYPFTVNLLGFD
jgi:N-methylhydantoinase A